MFLVMYALFEDSISISLDMPNMLLNSTSIPQQQYAPSMYKKLYIYSLYKLFDRE